MPWHFHPESDCYFWAMEDAIEFCDQVPESQVPEYIRNKPFENSLRKGQSMDIEGTAVRVAIGDETQDPQAVVDMASSVHAPLIPNDRLVKIYIKIRDAKRAAVKAFEDNLEKQYDGPLRTLQTELKQRCTGAGNTGLKTEYGTVYLAEAMKVSCNDWGIFYSWAKERNVLENFLEQRIKQGEVKAYMEDHAGELPPGVSVFRELEARVRKPTKKGSKAVGDAESDE